MTNLALISIALGTLMIVSRLSGIIAPEKFRKIATSFARSTSWGKFILAIAAIWAITIVYNDTSEAWDKARPYILIAIPVCYFLVVTFGQQFLALRAAAALLLLIAKVMLDAADQSESSFRLIMTVLSYVWVIIAIWAAGAPHHIRDLTNFLMADRENQAIIPHTIFTIPPQVLDL